MHLDQDGGITLAGVKLTAEQVAEIKAAKPMPKPTLRTGWWICGNTLKPPIPHWFLGQQPKLTSHGSVIDVNGTAYTATNSDYIIFWTTA